ncbi:MAG: hypothetical protein DRH26_15880 [Deltaproteobacteria bacterium]|nr:MAG: hypothetical protein DRH26_15880 [Deltaproteobacteria bacterium]
MKYRLCKNKYGYYKIQRFVYDKKNDSNQSFCEQLFSCFSLGAWGPKGYFWQDTFDQTVYETQKEATDRIALSIAREKERLERSDNSWECAGITESTD